MTARTKLVGAALAIALSTFAVTSSSFAAKETGTSTAAPRTLEPSRNWFGRQMRRFLALKKYTSTGVNSIRADKYLYDPRSRKLELRWTEQRTQGADGTKIVSSHRIVPPHKRAPLAEARRLLQDLADAKHWRPGESVLQELGQNIRGKKGRVIRKSLRLLDGVGIAGKIAGGAVRYLTRGIQASRRIDESLTKTASADGKQITVIIESRLGLADREIESKIVWQDGRITAVKTELPEYEDYLTGGKYVDNPGDAIRDALSRREAGNEPTRTMLRVIERRIARLKRKFKAADKNPLTRNRPSPLDAEALADALAAAGTPPSAAERTDLVTRALSYKLEAGLKGVSRLRAGRKVTRAQAAAFPELRRDIEAVSNAISQEMIRAAGRKAKLPPDLLKRVSEAQTWLEMTARANERKRYADRSKEVDSLQLGNKGHPGLRPQHLIEGRTPMEALELLSRDTSAWANAWKLTAEQWQHELQKGLMRSLGRELLQSLQRVETIIGEQNPYRAHQGKLALEQVERIQQLAAEHQIDFDGDNAVQRALRRGLDKIGEYREQLEALSNP